MKKPSKVVIITGAAGGIGLQIARDFDNKGNILCLCDINERIYEVHSLLKNATVFLKQLDCSIEKEVNLFIENIIKDYKKIDSLINCAGVVPYFSLEDTSYETFLNTLNSNIGAYFLFSKTVAREMKKNKEGTIVNIASISAHIGINGQVSYASSKGAIVSLTRVLASELGEYGIRVNSISPGSILVERNKERMMKKYEDKEFLKNHIPLCRLGVPKDISGVVEFLTSEKASYIHGADIVVDGGQTIK
jgi:NAD(P)-dependent dehydrogenase (short-subunit alcohol dehydrogenase family)